MLESLVNFQRRDFHFLRFLELVKEFTYRPNNMEVWFNYERSNTKTIILKNREFIYQLSQARSNFRIDWFQTCSRLITLNNVLLSL